MLPQVDNIRLERAGSERWLVVQEPPDKVWPVVRDFWQERGFLIKQESPEAGVMETDWAENRANLPQDFIRGLLGRFADQVYSTAERDKFRTRLERSPDGKGTEVYISHRGMREVYTTSERGNEGQTVWQPRDADQGSRPSSCACSWCAWARTTSAYSSPPPPAAAGARRAEEGRRRAEAAAGQRAL